MTNSVKVTQPKLINDDSENEYNRRYGIIRREESKCQTLARIAFGDSELVLYSTNEMYQRIHVNGTWCLDNYNNAIAYRAFTPCIWREFIGNLANKKAEYVRRTYSEGGVENTARKAFHMKNPLYGEGEYKKITHHGRTWYVVRLYTHVITGL